MDQPSTPPRPSTTPPPRPVYRSGKLHYDVARPPIRRLTDIYHYLLRTTWTQLFCLGAVAYVLVNLAFAFAYAAGGPHVAGVRPGHLADAFWFSVQTISTIGYGALSPITTYAHLLVTLESFVGLVAMALGTGLMFSKFSRPTARVGFSRHMVVHERDGVPCLQFRMANERRNQIVEARLSVSVLVDRVTEEGQHLRRFLPLRLERETSPIFALTWLAIHPLDPSSPLHGLSQQNVSDRVMAVVATLSGIDDTFAQTVYARHLYLAEDILFERRFEDMLGTSARGLIQINYELLHETMPASS